MRLPTTSTAKLNDPTIVNPSFTADAPGEYEVVLVVSNGVMTSEPVSVVVTAGPCGAQPPQVSAIQTGETLVVGAPVQLSAEASDPDHENGCAEEGASSRLRYAWRLLSHPEGSTASLNDPTLKSPSFVPDVGLEDYVFEVTVTDSTGRSATSDPDATAPCALEQPLTHAWRLVQVPAGSSASLLPQGPEAELLPDVPGRYTVELSVRDPEGHEARERIDGDVKCGGSAPEIANVKSAPAAPRVGERVSLEALAADPDDADGCSSGAGPA